METIDAISTSSIWYTYILILHCICYCSFVHVAFVYFMVTSLVDRNHWSNLWSTPNTYYDVGEEDIHKIEETKVSLLSLVTKNIFFTVKNFGWNIFHLKHCLKPKSYVILDMYLCSPSQGGRELNLWTSVSGSTSVKLTCKTSKYRRLVNFHWSICF